MLLILRRALFLFALASLAPCIAHADAPRARLAMVRASGAESCPGEDVLIGEVVARLGRNPFDPTAERAIDVVLQREGQLWVARIFVRETRDAAAGVRVMTSESPGCDPLGTAVALAVALAIDPEAPILPPPSGRTRLALAPPAATVATPPAPRAMERVDGGAPNAPSPPRPWDSRERAIVRLGVIAGPLPTPAATLGLAMDTSRWRFIRGSFGATLSQEAFVPGSGRRFGFSLASLFAGMCAGTSVSRLSVQGCTGAQLGLIYAGVHGGELEPVPPGGYPWFALSLGARAAIRLFGPVIAELGLEATLAPFPWRFVVERATAPPQPRNVVLVFEQPAVGLVAYLGIGVSIP